MDEGSATEKKPPSAAAEAEAWLWEPTIPTVDEPAAVNRAPLRRRRQVAGARGAVPPDEATGDAKASTLRRRRARRLDRTLDAVDFEHVLRLAKEDFSKALVCETLALLANEHHGLLLERAEWLLEQTRHEDLALLVYLLAEQSSVELALRVAMHANDRSRRVDALIIAVADMRHRAGEYDRALQFLEDNLVQSSSDEIVTKYCDFARDIGKSFLAEAMLKRFIRLGRERLTERLADHFVEVRDWSALRACLNDPAVTGSSAYLTYLLGRANVSLLLEADVIGCADRLWAMADPGPRFAQLLVDVWRWRIGDVESSPPVQDPAGLPYWLANDAAAIRDSGSSAVDLSTAVRSTAGWRSLRPRENLPNVLGIGAQRCGTTWMHYHLSRRSEVQPLPNKEPVFFSDVLVPPAEGVDGAVDPYWRGPTRNLFRYLRLYGAGFDVRADFSPSYLDLPRESIATARDLLGPDVQIIASVRDPVCRSWSNLQYDMKLAGVDPRSLSFSQRTQHYRSESSYRRSDYVTSLVRWKEFFPFVKVVFFDDIVASPGAVLDDLTDFLRLPRLNMLDIETRINQGFDQQPPSEDCMFLLGLHAIHYDKAEAFLGGPALTWRARHFA